MDLNKKPPPYQENPAMGVFERGLSLWIGLSIMVGVILGQAFPKYFEMLSLMQFANVNFIVAFLIWTMIYPMMIKVDFKSLFQVARKPKGLILTTTVNWLIKPFSMAFLAVLFFETVFKDLINPSDAKQYIAGLIILGAAPCTAMVFVWSNLTDGDPGYTLIQVSLNDFIMIFAFAPIVALLLGVTDLYVPWQTLTASVVIYVVIPLLAGIMTRQYILKNLEYKINSFSEKSKPLSIFGLLGIVILLFGFQGSVIIEKPLIMALIAVPLILQSYGVFIIAYLIAWMIKIPFRIAAPSALIGTSNFFELAVAVAVSLFGLNSGAALATVVGVLVEVPVMLSLVWLANNTKEYFTTE